MHPHGSVYLPADYDFDLCAAPAAFYRTVGSIRDWLSDTQRSLNECGGVRGGAAEIGDSVGSRIQGFLGKPANTDSA